MTVHLIKTAFQSGELSPSVWGRVDEKTFHAGCSVMRNCFVSHRGSGSSRAGLRFAGHSPTPAGPGRLPPVLIHFQYNVFQSYLLELGAHADGTPYMRIIADGAYVIEDPLAVTAATATNPVTVTVPGNDFGVGDSVFAESFEGMTELNGRTFNVLVVAGDVVILADTFGRGLDGTPQPTTTWDGDHTTWDHHQTQWDYTGPYTGGGTLARIYENRQVPYALKDLPYLKTVQSADVMTMTCVNQEDGTEYPPADLSRYGITDWRYAVTTFAAQISAPASLTAVPTTTLTMADTGNHYVPAASYGYAVTAVSAAGEESVASPYAFTPITPPSATSVDISLTAGSIILTWPAVPGALTYNVFKAPSSVWNSGATLMNPGTPVPIGSSFGYIGTAFGTQFVDNNIVPDLTTTPPLHNNPFARGQIQWVQPVNIGSGYTQANTTVSITSATGTGAVILPVVDFGTPTAVPAGVVQSVFVTAPGTGYSTSTTTLTINTSGGSGAALTPVIDPTGAITSITVTNGGTGYSTSDTITIHDSASGTGATATLSVSTGYIGGGTVAGYIVQNGGVGYQPTDTLVVTGDGSGATGLLQVGPETGTYPGVCGYFQSRRVYGATSNRPDTLFFSQTDAYTNMDASTPPVDSDAIVLTPWGQQVNTIQWLVVGAGGGSNVGSLLACTGLDCWQIQGYSGGPLTPSSEAASPQEANGFSPLVPPLRVFYDVIYCQELGYSVRDLQYNFFVNMYAGMDLSVLSNHLFAGYKIVSWGWLKIPWRQIWAVRDDGKLLSLTYDKELQLAGWSRHDTNGLFMRTAISTEPPVDAPYFVVQRYIPGVQQWVYYIERMDNHFWQAPEETWCIDCGLELFQPKPAAALSASAADGPGTISGGYFKNSGKGYLAPTAKVFDPTGNGHGFEMKLKVKDGVIVGFRITHHGKNYSPATEVYIEDLTGKGALFVPIIDQNVVFSATAAVFHSTLPGDVIRIGGGQASVTKVIDDWSVAAKVTVPILKTIPFDPNKLPVPAPSGDWSITTPVNSIGGLEHLEGMTVTGLADGRVIAPTVVKKGSITLAQPASAVRVGLPFTAQLQALHLEEASQGTIQGRRKKISKLSVRMEQTRGIQAGANRPVAAALDYQQEIPWDNLVDVPEAPNQNVPPAALPLFTGDATMPIDDDWQNYNGWEGAPAMVAVQQTQPLPMSITALVPEFTIGDSDPQP